MDRATVRKQVVADHLAPSSSKTVDVVSYELNPNGVVLLTINNPPVNALSPAVLSAIHNATRRAHADPSCRAIVITGSGNNFVAGADIRHLQNMQLQNGDFSRFVAENNAILRHIETGPKPAVAAIDGVCLGGGLELAMGCHARVCTPRSTLGLPELKLGLIPGFGGTQRLPRLVGVKKAIEVMLLSRTINGKDAQDLGLVDETASDKKNCLETASRIALDMAAGKRAKKITLNMTERLEPAKTIRGIVAKARKAANEHDPNAPHPVACLDAIEAGALNNGTIGLEKESARFCDIANSESARDLIKKFFASRPSSAKK